MKIGDFARKYHVPKSTVRHYTNIGLLLPIENGSQFNYTSREEADIQYILKLKDMRFSIDEIKTLMQLRRSSKMIEPESIQQYLQLLEKKRDEINQSIHELEQSAEMVRAEISHASMRSGQSAIHMGVPLKAVPLLHCPSCQAPLQIENASLSGNCISSGVLRCSCGYHAEIRDGIICTGNYYTGEHDSPDTSRTVYRSSGDKCTIYFQRCMDYMKQEIAKTTWTGKVVLEADVNFQFFMYSNTQYLPKDCLYIITDKYEEVLQTYKRLFEHLGEELDILFIADASMNYPLAGGSVDLLISFMEDNGHALYYKNSFIGDIAKFLKPGADIVGCFLSFPPGSQSLKNLRKRYPEGGHNMYSVRELKAAFQKSGCSIHITEVGQVFETLKHHILACHQNGDPMGISYYTGKKSS